MTTYSSGSTPPTSWTVSTFGCDSDASSCASRRKRARRRSADAAAARLAQALDRDLALQLGVERRVDDAHAADAQRLEQLVALAQPVAVAGHHGARQLGQRAPAGGAAVAVRLQRLQLLVGQQSLQQAGEGLVARASGRVEARGHRRAEVIPAAARCRFQPARDQLEDAPQPLGRQPEAPRQRDARGDQQRIARLGDPPRRRRAMQVVERAELVDRQPLDEVLLQQQAVGAVQRARRPRRTTP